MSFHWIVVQPVVPDYRDGFFPLMERSLPSLAIISGEKDFLPSVRKTRENYEGLITVQNVFFANRAFLWQRGVVSRCLGKDVVVLNFNTRVISSWVVAICRKITGKPTLLWGHISGRNKRLHRVRHLMMRLCNGFITYTESERKKLAEMHPEIRSFTAPNACLPREKIQYVDSTERKHVLYVGRLEEAKRPLLAVDAFLRAAESGQLGDDILLHVIGEGSQTEVIEEKLKEHPLGHRVRLNGHIADTQQLKKFYSEARLSLSTGYIGLSAMQSFAFGVPMLVSKDEHHSPEIAMCEENFNTHFIHSSDAGEWANNLVKVFSGEIAFAPGKKISDRIRDQYSFEVMAARFVDAVQQIAQG